MHRSVAIDLSAVESDHPHSTVTAQTFSLSEVREGRTKALAIAMRAAGTSERQLADALGVCKTLARDLRTGRRPLTDARISLFGPRLRAAYEAALREGVQLTLF